LSPLETRPLFAAVQSAIIADIRWRSEVVGGGHTDPVTGERPDYRYVLFDLDHTLFDFEASKVEAFAEVMAIEGHENHDELRSILSTVERPLWQEVERGERNVDDLNRLRFARLNETAGLDADVDRMAANYLDGLGRSGGLFPGARELLTELQMDCTLGLITNGYGEVQRPRLVNFDIGHFFDAIVISGELGISKPDPRFFDDALRQLGNPARRNTQPRANFPECCSENVIARV